MEEARGDREIVPLGALGAAGMRFDGRSLPWLWSAPSTWEIDGLALDERTVLVFAVSHDTMSTAPNTGMVTMLDEHTGHLLRRTSVGPFPSRLVIAQGRVYVLDTNDYAGPGHVSILDVATCRLLRTVPLAGIAGSLALEDERHQVVVGLQDGSSQPLDTHTGLLLLRVTPARSSVTLGNDPDTQRAFTTPVTDTLGAAIPPKWDRHRAGARRPHPGGTAHPSGSGDARCADGV